MADATSHETTIHETTIHETNIHASCVAIGEGAILIRGESGAGKSRLALALLDEAAARGHFARLVGDDRIRLSQAGGRIIARGHPAIAGLIEWRHVGPVAAPRIEAALVRLVVDLDSEAARLPAETDRTAEIGTLSLPRLRLAPDGGLAVRLLAYYLTIRGCK